MNLRGSPVENGYFAAHAHITHANTHTRATETPLLSLLTSIPLHRNGQLGDAVRLRELILYGNPLENAPSFAKDADTGPLFEFLAAVNRASR